MMYHSWARDEDGELDWESGPKCNACGRIPQVPNGDWEALAAMDDCPGRDWSRLLGGRLARRSELRPDEFQNPGMHRHGDPGIAAGEVVIWDIERAKRGLPPWKSQDGRRFYSEDELQD